MMPSPPPTPRPDSCLYYDAVIVGGGLAGLSAAVYLGRSRRKTLVIESGRSMAVWEADVQNYLGFPDGIAGSLLLERGRAQALRFGAQFKTDEVTVIRRMDSEFEVEAREGRYRAKRVLLATGLTHLPPDIPGARECLGQSLFFCKDCDAFRVQGRRIAIIGRNNEAAEYALAMLMYSPNVVIATNGKAARWDAAQQRWLEEYGIPVHEAKILRFIHDRGRLCALVLEGERSLSIDCAFTTRGDVYHTRLAEGLHATLNEAGEVEVDQYMRTSVPGLYAAGCMTPANCQMIIAAGQGATAGQAINRDLFEESLQTHALPIFGERREPGRRAAVQPVTGGS